MNPHAQAVSQLDAIRESLEKIYVQSNQKQQFDRVFETLKTPDRVLESEIEITLDSGEKAKYLAFRSQHNNSRGPYKGGIRFHQGVTKEEVMALSTWMTWKTSVVNLPLGGAKGGVVVDPRTLSQEELQRLSRAYVRAFSEHLGSMKDIPAPDVNTNGQIMAWMLDEYEQGIGKSDPGAFTGKPIELGGSLGREQATGYGGAVVLAQVAAQLGMNPSNTTVAVQGIGNVGYWFIRRACEMGFRVIAVSDSKGGVVGQDTQSCLHLVGLMDHKKSNGSLDGFPGTRSISNDELLELDVDILVPAALEQVLTKDNAGKVKAKIVLELANGPTTPDADDTLKQAGVIVVPDIFANSGGVAVSSFEWSQNLYGFRWTEAEVLQKLEPLLKIAFDAIWTTSTREGMSLREAATFLAVRKVIDAAILRGVKET